MAGIGVFLFDHDLRYTLAESTGLEEVGLSREQLEGRTIWELFPPDVCAKLEPVFRAALAGTDASLEMPFHHHFCRLSAVPLRGDRGIAGGMLLTQRITEEKQLEQQLQQAQKMDAVGRLAGGVAHDFNNLLQVIRGYAELLARENGAGSPGHAAGILEAADQAAALTDQLLSLSRQSPVEPHLLDLNELVRDTKKLLERVLEEDIALATELEPHPLAVRADQGRLNQVLVNLAVNARDAMPAGGRLVIKTESVEVGEQWPHLHGDLPPGLYARLTVGDTGTGIDPETLTHIFEPFFTTKPPDKGTGLGLSTVFGIARQFGGTVHVYSEPGHGASFSVYLPLALEDVDADDCPAAAPPLAGSESILLVEDDDTVRAVVRQMLEAQGYAVIEASGPDVALSLCTSDAPFSLVITDSVMPGMNGDQLVARIAAVRPDTRVLFMSGHTSLTPAGDPVAFVQKPFSASALAGKVREVLDA